MTEHLSNDRAGKDRCERGFTLTEVLIVVAMIGLLTGALAAIFTVIVRTTPDAEDRVNDARSIQGLVTWLPQDIDATPPDGFNRTAGHWPCAGSAPAGSTNVLSMAWSEVTGSTTNYAASYRSETDGTDTTMARYECTPNGPATRVNLTAELSATMPQVEMCAVQLNASTGACDTLIAPADTTTPVLAIKLIVTHLSGQQSTIDAASKNPDENLADDPEAVTKFPPGYDHQSINVSLQQGATEVRDLFDPFVGHGISDPDSSAAQLSVAVDSYQPTSPDLTIGTPGALDVSITADAAAAPGSHDVYLIVSDEVGNFVGVTIHVVVTPAPATTFVVGTFNYDLALEPSETIRLPIELTNNVSDPYGDPLTVDVPVIPDLGGGSLSFGGAFDPMELEITAPAAPSVAGYVLDLEIRDDEGFVEPARVTVTYVAAGTNNGPIAVANVNVSMTAGATATINVTDAAPAGHALTDPDGDLVLVTVDGSQPAPVDLTTSIEGYEVTVESDIWLDVGPVATPISLLFADVHGAAVSATVNVTIVPSPPASTTCVLGTLSTDHPPPAGVDRVASPGGGAKLLLTTVTVTLTWSGICDGLTLTYSSGHPSGLGDSGRLFPNPSGAQSSSIVILGDADAGTEKFVAGTVALTASTTSATAAATTIASLQVN